MAYTSVIPVRRLDRAVKYVMNKEKTTAVSLQDALDYAANRDKTEQSCFESSYRDMLKATSYFGCSLFLVFADAAVTQNRIPCAGLFSPAHGIRFCFFSAVSHHKGIFVDIFGLL